jgi:glycosyltransferase involved in cell wall biosynthesis
MKSTKKKVKVLRITPSFASHTNPGSGTNAYFHSKFSKFRSYILTEEKKLNYLGVGKNVSIKTIKTFKSNLGEIGDIKFIFKLFNKFISTLVFTIKSISYVKSIKPEIVHIYSPIYILTALFCKLIYKSKIVMTIHGTDGLRIQNFKAFKILFSISDVNLSLSNKFIENIGRNDIQFLGNGYDNSIFNYKNILNRRKYIISVGNLRWQKNHIEMIQSFNIFLKYNKGYKLIIVGEGDLRIKLENEITKLNLEKSVFLVGKKDQKYITRLMNIAELFYLTSITEGSPKVIFEAMACGLPIVSTDVGDIRVNTSSESCFIVDNDINSMANGLKEIAEIKSYDRISISKKIKQKSWENVSIKLDDIYEKIRK